MWSCDIWVNFDIPLKPKPPSYHASVQFPYIQELKITFSKNVHKITADIFQPKTKIMLKEYAHTMCHITHWQWHALSGIEPGSHRLDAYHPNHWSTRSRLKVKWSHWTPWHSSHNPIIFWWLELLNQRSPMSPCPWSQTWWACHCWDQTLVGLRPF